jgi:hypothetical protein
MTRWYADVFVSAPYRNSVAADFATETKAQSSALHSLGTILAFQKHCRNELQRRRVVTLRSTRDTLG